MPKPETSGPPTSYVADLDKKAGRRTLEDIDRSHRRNALPSRMSAVTLESTFVKTETPQTTVFVYCVGPARKLVQPTLPVLKFSEKRYAIPRAAVCT